MYVGAANNVSNEGIICNTQIMIPLICSDHEMEYIASIVSETAESVKDSCGKAIPYQLGAMLEVPRACLLADKIVQKNGLGFVSLGSNDLTQMMVCV